MAKHTSMVFFALSFVTIITDLYPVQCSRQLTEIHNDCACPGDVLTYECNVQGAGFTIWTGTAFDCPSVESKIVLRHSSFDSDGDGTHTCNDGAIIARRIRSTRMSTADNNEVSNYISSLTVNLTFGNTHLNGRTVECLYRSNNGAETLIGSKTIQITGAHPPPTNVILLTAYPQELVFRWNPVDTNCTSLEYGIFSDCGTCTNKTVQTSEVCHITSNLSHTINMTLCSFAVQSVVCGNIAGNLSAPINLKLKVPHVRVSSVIPIYNNDTGSNLMELEIRFKKAESFFISHGIDGSAFNYTISYSDSVNNTVCDSRTLSESALSCVEDECIIVHKFEISPCFKAELVNIAMSAVNRLGVGPATLLTIDIFNRYVNINVVSDKTISCEFIALQEIKHNELTSLTCDIIFWPCQQIATLDPKVWTGIEKSPNKVIIDLDVNSVLESKSMSTAYCYTVNASIVGTSTALIKGTITLKFHRDPKPLTATVSVPIITITVTAIFGVVAMILLWMFLKRDSKNIELTQQIKAHILFTLFDRPRQLHNALIPLKGCGVSIRNIVIGQTYTISNDTQSRVKIYIECEQDLTDNQVSYIQIAGIGIGNSLEVYKEAIQRSCHRNTGNTSALLNITLPERIVNRPGILILLLHLVYSIESWEQMIVTDVIISPSHNNEKSIVILSVADTASQWREIFWTRQVEALNKLA